MLRVKRESSIKQALLEADKLLDLGLKDKKTKGETMGERLKSAKNLFDNNLYNEIWQAHKLRNQMVHEDSEILSLPCLFFRICYLGFHSESVHCASSNILIW